MIPPSRCGTRDAQTALRGPTRHNSARKKRSGRSGRDDKTGKGKPKTHTQNRRVGHPARRRSIWVYGEATTAKAAASRRTPHKRERGAGWETMNPGRRGETREEREERMWRRSGRAHPYTPRVGHPLERGGRRKEENPRHRHTLRVWGTRLCHQKRRQGCRRYFEGAPRSGDRRSRGTQETSLKAGQYKE